MKHTRRISLCIAFVFYLVVNDNSIEISYAYLWFFTPPNDYVMHGLIILKTTSRLKYQIKSFCVGITDTCEFF